MKHHIFLSNLKSIINKAIKSISKPTLTMLYASIIMTFLFSCSMSAIAYILNNIILRTTSLFIQIVALIGIIVIFSTLMLIQHFIIKKIFPDE